MTWLGYEVRRPGGLRSTARLRFLDGGRQDMAASWFGSSRRIRGRTDYWSCDVTRARLPTRTSAAA